MKRIFAIVFIILLHIHSFAYAPLQIVIENESVTSPPPPNEEAGISPFDVGVIEGDETPIDFIYPFLLVSVFLLVLYIVKKRKQKLV